MTVQLIAQWGSQPPGTLYTSDAGTEAAMISNKVAIASLTGAVAWVPPGNSPGKVRPDDHAIVTQAQFDSLVAASALTVGALYNVAGALRHAVTTNTYQTVGGGATLATLPLTATSSGKRQQLGGAGAVKFTAAGSGSIYVRFSDGSGAIAVAATDQVVDCNASPPVQLQVPPGFTLLEYLRVASDVTFNLTLLG